MEVTRIELEIEEKELKIKKIALDIIKLKELISTPAEKYTNEKLEKYRERKDFSFACSVVESITKKAFEAGQEHGN